MKTPDRLLLELGGSKTLPSPMYSDYDSDLNIKEKIYTAFVGNNSIKKGSLLIEILEKEQSVYLRLGTLTKDHSSCIFRNTSTFHLGDIEITKNEFHGLCCQLNHANHILNPKSKVILSLSIRRSGEENSVFVINKHWEAYERVKIFFAEEYFKFISSNKFNELEEISEFEKYLFENDIGYFNIQEHYID